MRILTASKLGAKDPRSLRMRLRIERPDFATVRLSVQSGVARGLGVFCIVEGCLFLAFAAFVALNPWFETNSSGLITLLVVVVIPGLGTLVLGKVLFSYGEARITLDRAEGSVRWRAGIFVCRREEFPLKDVTDLEIVERTTGPKWQLEMVLASPTEVRIPLSQSDSPESLAEEARPLAEWLGVEMLDHGE